MKELTLTTEIENADFYIASIAIGILTGMLEGSVSLQEGIWSLGRPRFWKSLEGKIDSDLYEIIESFDEFPAMDTFNMNIKEIIKESVEKLIEIQKRALETEPNLVIESGIN